MKKIIASPYTEAILQSGNKVVCHGWAKVGARGKAKFWKVTVTEIAFVNGSMTPVLLEVTETSPAPSLFSGQVPARDTGDEFNEGEVAI